MRPPFQTNTRHCRICKEVFTWYKRRHHCRKCGLCICADCVPFYDVLPMLGYSDPVKVCSSCHPMPETMQPGSVVLLLGRFIGRIHSMITSSQVVILVSKTLKERLRSHVDAFTKYSAAIKEKSASEIALFCPVKYISSYSAVKAASIRLQATVRGMLARHHVMHTVNFETCNELENRQEQQTMALKTTHVTSSLKVPMDPPTWLVVQDPSYHGAHVDTLPLSYERTIHLMDTFRDGVPLHRIYVSQLLRYSIHQLEDTPTMVEISNVELDGNKRITVVGDLHAQLEDLLTIFTLNGLPSLSNLYVFNGDFVDRGAHGVEVALILLAWKMVFPTSVFINRGNHESRTINSVFGFRKEVVAKYANNDDEKNITIPYQYTGRGLWNLFNEVFDRLPLCTLIHNKIFIVHGGLSSHTATLSSIRSIPHQREPPVVSETVEEELYMHLLWSDPKNELVGTQPSARGAGVEFGVEATRKFCRANQIALIIRSHECKQEGYEFCHDGRLLTVFSASYYCGTQTNKGAYVVLQASTLIPEIHTFYAQPLQRLDAYFETKLSSKRKQLAIKTIVALKRAIWTSRKELDEAFAVLPSAASGYCTVLNWRNILQKILKIPNLPFFLYASDLLDTNYLHNGVDYTRFLQNCEENKSGT